MVRINFSNFWYSSIFSHEGILRYVLIAILETERAKAIQHKDHLEQRKMRLERKIRAADQSIIYLKAELIKLNSKIELFKFKQRVQDNNFKHQYLEKNIFQGLNNLNDGFDVPDVRYFNKEDFEKVLDRVKEKGIGIYGIECWRDGEYYDIDTYENHQTYPQNPNWYFKAFERFKQMDKNLLYSASYYVPSNF